MEPAESSTTGAAGREPVPVLVVLDTGQTLDGEGRLLPTVVVDTADTPEVADLARVHAVEGVGDIRTEAVRSGDLVLLGVRMTTPVRAAFALAFDLRPHRPLLEDVIAHGSLVIAHTDPELAEVEQSQWLALDIDGPALADRIGTP